MVDERCIKSQKQKSQSFGISQKWKRIPSTQKIVGRILKVNLKSLNLTRFYTLRFDLAKALD
jgi:hypothetical protein